MMFAALAGNLVQHRPVFSAARLKPDLAKLSPMKGFKRLFGLDGSLNFIKGVAKILLVGGACFWALWPERGAPRHARSTLRPPGIADLALALIFKAVLAAPRRARRDRGRSITSISASASWPATA